MRSRRTRREIDLVERPTPTFAEIYDAHVDEVYCYVHRRCQDHPLAEDVTQDTFMAVIAATNDPNTISIGWLITVARNRLFDIVRRQVTYERKLKLVAGDATKTDELDIAERLRVESALGALPEHYRLILTLHYINGMTVRAIADELDQSLKSVEGIVTRARRELIALLEADQPCSAEEGES